MNRAQVLDRLAKSKPLLSARYGVTEKALRPELRPFVEREAVHV